jgi:hypothetical protein
MKPTPPPPPVRSLGALALRLVRQWWPHLAALAVASGVVATTIAGALGVGEALERGLRRLALARLGGSRAAVLSDAGFPAAPAAVAEARLRSLPGHAGPGRDGGGRIGVEGPPEDLVVHAARWRRQQEAAAKGGPVPAEPLLRSHTGEALEAFGLG